MEYYSAFRKEILTHAATWMNSEDIMVNEVSLSRRTNTLIPLIQGT